MAQRMRSAPVRVRINESGRIVIPAALRDAVGISRGEEVIVWAQDGEVRIASAIERARRAQRLVREYVPEGVSLSEELLADRRRESSGE
jgi:AbrB family looped-hinge helix DNA binding protein